MSGSAMESMPSRSRLFAPGGGEQCAVRKLLLQVRYREAQHNAVKR